MIKVRILTEDNAILGEYQLRERGNIDGKMEEIASWVHGGSDAMTARDILIAGLKAMGADGLFWLDGDDVCGCGLDDLEPCEHCNLDRCVPAKRKGEMFYPMEEQ